MNQRRQTGAIRSRLCSPLSLILITILSACGAPPLRLTTSPVPPAPNPISVDGSQVGLIAVVPLTTSLAPGTALGGNFDDDTALRIRESDNLMFVWQPSYECELREVVTPVLKMAGYKTLRGPGCSVFGNVEDESASADVLLGGSIDNFTWNTFNRPGRADVEVFITWELLSRRDRRVLYKEGSYGAGSVAGAPTVISGQALHDAMRESIRRILADADFVSHVRAVAAKPVEPSRVTVEPPPIPAAVDWNRPIPAETDLIHIQPTDLRPVRRGSVVERVSRAVFTLEGAEGSGSGFVITSDGLALTNYHVVKDEATISARLPDGSRVPARVLRRNELADVALVQILCDRCSTVHLGRGDAPAGTDVYLVGSPLGLTTSVTRGIVSGQRLLRGVTYLQTDAAANPGNSGGPLVEMETGEVVGILTFGLRDTEGLAFAISITDALRVLGIRYQN